MANQDDIDLINEYYANTPSNASVSTPSSVDEDIDLINKHYAEAENKPVAISPVPSTTWDRIKQGFENYQNKDLSNYQRESAGNAQGARDVLASVQNLAGNSTLGGFLPSQEENTTARNKFNEQYGQDPVAGIGRFAGNALASTPLLMAGEGTLGLAGKGIISLAPETVGPVTRFLGNGIESNKLVNAAGETIQGASTGNKLLRLGSGATANAGRGAAQQSLISSESDQPIGQQLLTGAEIGAGLGTLGPIANAGYNKIVGNAKLVAPYIDKLAQSFSRDNALNNVGDQLTAAGPEATLADLGGANVRARAGAVAQSPGPGANIAEQALNERHSGQVDRLTQASLKGLDVDPSQTYEATVQKLDDQRKTAAAPLYQQAYQANKSMASPELNRVLDTPAGNAALKDAVRIMQNSRKNVAMTDPELVEQAKLAGTYEPGSGGIGAGLNMETLDYTKKALDDAYARSKTALHPKGDTSILDVKNDLLGEMDKLDTTSKAGPNSTKTEGGAYSQARAAWAGPSQSANAVDAGYDFMKNGGNLSKISDVDKPFYRVGAANWVRDTLQNTADGANAVRKVFNTPAKRDALKSIFPSDAAFDEFKSTVENEGNYAKTRNSVLGNSQTVPRAAAMEDLNSTPFSSNANKLLQLAGHAGELGQRNMLGKALYLGKLGAGKVLNPKTISQEMSEQLGNALFTPEGSAVAANSMTPVTQPQNRQGMLSWYLQHLGVPNSVIGNNLINVPQPTGQQ